MEISALCTRFVNLCDASRHPEYLAGLQETIAVAQRLGCPTIISQAGNELPGVPREQHHAAIVQGLRQCAPMLEAAGLTLVLEPLNTTVNHKGYYLWSSQEGFDIVDEVGSPHVRLLFDIYHQQIMEGHLISHIVPNIDKIGHFHAAGNPGRHEITSGEINYVAVFQAIRATGYEKYCALEYKPALPIPDSLQRSMALIRQSAADAAPAEAPAKDPVYPQAGG